MNSSSSVVSPPSMNTSLALISRTWSGQRRRQSVATSASDGRYFRVVSDLPSAFQRSQSSLLVGFSILNRNRCPPSENCSVSPVGSVPHAMVWQPCLARIPVISPRDDSTVTLVPSAYLMPAPSLFLPCGEPRKRQPERRGRPPSADPGRSSP